MSELTAQQARFVDEYLVDLNAGQAAKRAGYSDVSGNHYFQGSRLLRNAHIAAAIEKAREKRGEKLGVKADRVVLELMRIAFADQRRVMRWDAENGVVFEPSDTLDDDTAAAVAEVADKITVMKNGTKREQRVKMYDKIRALELLGRHLGMWKADTNDANSGMAQFLQLLSSGAINIDQVVDHLGKK